MMFARSVGSMAFFEPSMNTTSDSEQSMDTAGVSESWSLPSI